MLYNMAVNTMPPEALQGIVKMWNKVVLKSIDMDASLRTHYLEGTKLGRVAKINEEPDGEELRLHCLDQWKLAKSVVDANLLNPTIIDEDFDLFGEDEGPVYTLTFSRSIQSSFSQSFSFAS